MSESQGFSFPDSESLSGQPQYGGFWWRFLACFIDGVIIQVGSFLLLIVPSILLGLTLAASGVSNDFRILISGLFGMIARGVISWLYYGLMESSIRQATLGKLVCRLKVVNKEGERLGFGRASARQWGRLAHSFIFSVIGTACFVFIGLLLTGASSKPIVALLSSVNPGPEALFPLLGILLWMMVGGLLGSIAGYLPALWTPKKQTLHDLIAGTVVVKKIKEKLSETVVPVLLSPDP